MKTRCGLVLLVLLAAPSAASAATGPLLSLTPERVAGSAANRVALAGQPWRVRVVMQPYVAGQTATVRFYRHGHKLRAVNVNLLQSSTGSPGTRSSPSRRRWPAASRSRRRTSRRRPRHSSSPSPCASTSPRCASGPARAGRRCALLQSSSRRSATWSASAASTTTAPRARCWPSARSPAWRARRTPAPTSSSALAKGKGAFHVRHPDHGKHVEADLSEQVIALIRGSKVERIYPASSGKPSTPTVHGTFRVYSKSPGFNAKGMYFSNYFIRGFAIHGYAEVPVFAASHGCLRVPIPDAISIYNWIKIGDIVDVYP